MLSQVLGSRFFFFFCKNSDKALTAKEEEIKCLGGGKKKFDLMSGRAATNGYLKINLPVTFTINQCII